MVERKSLCAILALLAIGAIACSQEPGAGRFSAGGDEPVLVYSGRNESLIGPLLERFSESGDKPGPSGCSLVEVATPPGPVPPLATSAAESGPHPAMIFSRPLGPAGATRWRHCAPNSPVERPVCGCLYVLSPLPRIVGGRSDDESPTSW